MRLRWIKTDVSHRVVVSCRCVACPRRGPRTPGARGAPPGHTGYTGGGRATIQSLAIQLDCPLRTSLLGRVLVFREFGAIGPVAVRGPTGFLWRYPLSVNFGASILRCGAVLSLPVTPRVRFTTQNAPHAHRRLQTRRPLQHTPTHDTYARAALPSRSQSHRRAPKFFLVLFRDFISASGTGCSSKRLVRGL